MNVKNFQQNRKKAHKFERSYTMLLKKIVASALAVCMLLSISACSGGKDPESSGTDINDNSTVSTTTSSTNGDGSLDVGTTTLGTDGTSTSNADGTSTGGGRATRSSKSTNKTASTTKNPNVTVTTKNQTELKNYYQRDEIKGTTIKILLWYAPDKDEKKEFDDFETMTGAKVKVIQTSYDNYQTKIASSIAARDPLDSVHMSADWYPAFVIRGLMQPIDNYIDKNDEVLDFTSMDLLKWGGKYYGVAGKDDASCMMVYFNKTMFDNTLGVKNPLQLYNEGNWNWNTFADLAKKMTVVSGGKTTRHGFAAYSYMGFMLSAGGSFFQIKNGKDITVSIKTSNAVAGWKFYKDLYSDGYAGDSGSNCISNFVSGKTAMLAHYSWIIKDRYTAPDTYSFASMNDEWDWVPFPSYPDGKSYQPVELSVWGIAKGSKNPLGAYLLNHWRAEGRGATSGSQLPNEEIQRLQKMYALPKGVDFGKSVMGSDLWSLCWDMYDPDGDIDSAVDEWLPKMKSAAERLMKEAK